MTAPRDYAVALRYQTTKDPAPRVTARGRGEIARRIIEEARRAGVPIREDADLVALLLQLDLNECIPPDLYEIVAEILLLLYHANEQWKRAHGLPALARQKPSGCR
jgi:flagellar biosynthesis protein